MTIPPADGLTVRAFNAAPGRSNGGNHRTIGVIHDQLVQDDYVIQDKGAIPRHRVGAPDPDPRELLIEQHELLGEYLDPPRRASIKEQVPFNSALRIIRENHVCHQIMKNRPAAQVEVFRKLKTQG